MENFIKHLLSIVIVDAEGVSLNSNIFETGLINIILLIAILIYSGKDFLIDLLQERKKAIVNAIQDAEQRLNEATRRLEEAQKQLNQADLVINQIKSETLAKKMTLLELEAYKSKKDLAVRFRRAFATFKTKERQIFLEIKQEIVFLVLERTILKAQQIFGSKKENIRLIHETINKLEGGIL